MTKQVEVTVLHYMLNDLELKSTVVTATVGESGRVVLADRSKFGSIIAVLSGAVEVISKLGERVF